MPAAKPDPDSGPIQDALATKLDTHALELAAGFTTLGLAMWTAQAVEHAVRSVEFFLRVGRGDADPPPYGVPLDHEHLMKWSLAESRLCKQWPDSVPKPDGIHERLKAVRDARNDMAHAIPEPMFLAMIGRSADPDPYAGLHDLMAQSEAVLEELQPLLAEVSGIRVEELGVSSMGILAVLLSNDDRVGAWDTADPEGEIDRLTEIVPDVTAALFDTPPTDS